MGQWLLRHGDAEVTIGAGVAPTILRAEYAVCPMAWTEWLEFADMNHLDIDPAGATTMYLRGATRPLEALLAWTRRDGADVYDRATTPPVPEDVVTRRQEEALAVATASGYYDTPHRVSMREIARQLGISVSATSALLRRAEAAVIKAHMDAVARHRWADMEEADLTAVPSDPSDWLQAPVALREREGRTDGTDHKATGFKRTRLGGERAEENARGGEAGGSSRRRRYG